MQRLPNTLLTLAVTVLMTAVSLVLLMAAWVMATPFLNGLTRSPLPKWLFVGLLAMSVSRVNAQPINTGTFVVIEERTTHPNGQVTISYSLATPSDTLPLPVRTSHRRPERVIPAKPDWPDTDLSSTEPPTEFRISGPVYSLGIQSDALTYPSNSRFRRRPKR